MYVNLDFLAVNLKRQKVSGRLSHSNSDMASGATTQIAGAIAEQPYNYQYC